MSDQERISPFNIKYNIKQTSYENKGRYQSGDNLLIDPVLNSLS